ncbi:MAG: hypothetical protein MUF35_00365 [Candidatus Nanopelagicales bacterium]|jgi:hypothetical protein|nr:hypothetical protein [Candidatus Nanopelagicales bacterium]
MTTMTRAGSSRRGRAGLVVSVLAGLVAVLIGSWILLRTALMPPTPTPVVAVALPGSDGQVAGVNPEARGVNTGDREQATGIRMRVEDPGRVPEALIGSGPTGGCVLGYGRGDACLPTVPPGERAHAGHHGEPADLASRWTCSDVRLLYPRGIAVNDADDGLGPEGVDPLGLDSNRDGVACGKADRD